MGISMPEQSVPTTNGEARLDSRLAGGAAGGDPPPSTDTLELLSTGEARSDDRLKSRLCITLTLGTSKVPYTHLHKSRARQKAWIDDIRRTTSEGMS